MENENNTPVNEELAHLQSLVESTGNGAEELAKLQESMKKAPVVEKTAEKKETITPEGKDGSEEKTGKEKVADKVEEEDEEEDITLDDEVDVLGINKSLKSKKANIELDEKALKFIEQKFAIKDANTFFNSSEKWRTDSQQLKKVQEEYENLLEGIKHLPPKLAESMNVWANGGDYEAVLQRERIDFSKKFEDHDKESVVAYFNKEAYNKLQKKLNDESITEEDYDDRLDDLHSSAKLLYDQNKRVFESQRAALLTKAEDDRKALKESAVSSVEKLKEAFPDFKPNELQSIRQDLINGNIDGLFKDKYGRYTENAAKAYAFAKHGEKMLRSALDRAKKKGTTEALEDIVMRADKTVKTNKAGETPNKQQQEKAIEHLSFGLDKKDPYS